MANDSQIFAAPMEVGAQFAFSIIYGLSRQAVAHRLMMRLDG